MNRTLRLLALAAALPLALSACNSGGDAGDTNVEKGSAKKGPTAPQDGTMGGDSATAGLARDTSGRPTGKQLFESADRAKDRNHDGIAD